MNTKILYVMMITMFGVMACHGMVPYDKQLLLERLQTCNIENYDDLYNDSETIIKFLTYAADQGDEQLIMHVLSNPIITERLGQDTKKESCCYVVYDHILECCKKKYITSEGYSEYEKYGSPYEFANVNHDVVKICFQIAAWLDQYGFYLHIFSEHIVCTCFKNHCARCLIREEYNFLKEPLFIAIANHNKLMVRHMLGQMVFFNVMKNQELKDVFVQIVKDGQNNQWAVAEFLSHSWIAKRLERDLIKKAFSAITKNSENHQLIPEFLCNDHIVWLLGKKLLTEVLQHITDDGIRESINKALKSLDK